MKFLVTPTFTEKLSSLASDGLPAIAAIVDFVKNTDKTALARGRSDVQVRMLDGSILTLKHGHYRIYASIGGDENEEYLLLLDVGVEQMQPMSKAAFFATKDPRKDSSLNPNINMTIDPRRNMMIDPNRNTLIDPRRNMMIDPNRNMMIDPRRNMMIDPNRNMMIDPRRNMMIDPNRNMMIDPRRNRYYGGPYLYDIHLNQEGFVVRANEKVSLLFDQSARFSGFVVGTDRENENIFDIHGSWIGFLVPTQSDVRLRFGTNGEWIGIIV
jgi:hypothetical protein